METQSVNWSALDAMVLDYMEQEHLSEDPEDGMSMPPGLNSPREIIHLIRSLIEAGRITEALHLMQQHAPVVLEDQRLLFRLHKQNFIELLRSGGGNAHMQAIECSRTHLGPCALNAYPEAYEEFKRVLLALMYDKDDVTSPVAEEWSEVRRAELAATIASTLKAQLQAYDSLLSLTLRYLISVHNGYCQGQGVPSPIVEVSSKVLSKDRDPPATPQESLLEAPKFSEGDVQGLAQAVELSRQGAVDSLRFTGGDLLGAFKNELSRLRVNVAAIDELVHEYSMYRGLVEGGPPPVSVNGKGSSSDAVAAQLSDVLATGVVNCFKAFGGRGPILHSASKGPWQSGEDMPASVLICAGSDDHLAVIGMENTSAVTGLHPITESSPMERADSAASDVVMEEPAVTEVVEETPPQESSSIGAPEEVRNSGMCSTSASSHVSVNGGRLTSPIAEVNKDKRRCRRWRGRRQPVVAGDYLEALWGSLSETRHCEPENGPRPAASSEMEEPAMPMDARMEHGDDVFELYGRALEIRQLASEGKTEAVIREVHKLNPSFFEHNAQLLFQLKQVEFLKLVEEGDHPRALLIARADLGPLATKFPDLLRPLKETLLALARPRGEPALKPTPPSVLAAALQVALGASLGIAEPQLMKVMRATLFSHTQWFKLQMCSDPFAELLNVNTLKETDAAAAAGNMPTSADDAKTAGGTGSCLSTTETSGNPPSDIPRAGPLFDEASILTLMEFLALSRAEVIQLLVQYDGSVENVFAHWMS